MRKDANGRNVTGRFSIKDSQESFIYINETMQSLEEHIDFLKGKGEPIQPFILALGEPKTLNISKCWLFLDGHLMPFSNFCRAIDICFKSYHLFNVEYPLPSRTFWIFIEQYFYNIAKNYKTVSKVSVLLDEISKN